MTSHEFARKLLALPDLHLHADVEEPKVEEIVDHTHPEYQQFEGMLMIEEDGTAGQERKDWWEKQPKRLAVVA